METVEKIQKAAEQLTKVVNGTRTKQAANEAAGGAAGGAARHGHPKGQVPGAMDREQQRALHNVEELLRAVKKVRMSRCSALSYSAHSSASLNDASG